MNMGIEGYSGLRASKIKGLSCMSSCVCFGRRPGDGALSNPKHAADSLSGP